MPATLTITSGRHSLQTVTHGVKPSTRPCPLSKKTAWTASRRNGTGGRHVWLRFQSQTRPSPATTATGHASPASALSATSVPAGDVDDPLLNLRSRSHAMSNKFDSCSSNRNNIDSCSSNGNNVDSNNGNSNDVDSYNGNRITLTDTITMHLRCHLPWQQMRRKQLQLQNVDSYNNSSNDID